jgi:hypothetical protein
MSCATICRATTPKRRWLRQPKYDSKHFIENFSPWLFGGAFFYEGITSTIYMPIFTRHILSARQSALQQTEPACLRRQSIYGHREKIVFAPQHTSFVALKKPLRWNTNQTSLTCAKRLFECSNRKDRLMICIPLTIISWSGSVSASADDKTKIRAFMRGNFFIPPKKTSGSALRAAREKAAHRGRQNLGKFHFGGFVFQSSNLF